MELDRQLSKALAQEIRAKDKNCWSNAVRAFCRLVGTAETATEGIFYVEGWAGSAAEGFVTKHGGVEMKGTIIDPTWTRNQADTQYFPTHKYTADELWHAMRPPASWPVTPYSEFSDNDPREDANDGET